MNKLKDFLTTFKANAHLYHLTTYKLKRKFYSARNTVK